MKTITIRIDSGLLREIRALASREGASVSSLLATHLQRIVDDRRTYQHARDRAVARLHRGFDLGWAPGLRGKLHER